jgi:hypothetical protein
VNTMWQGHRECYEGTGGLPDGSNGPNKKDTIICGRTISAQGAWCREGLEDIGAGRKGQ